MSKKNAKLLYFGLPLGALALLRAGLDVRTACISRTGAVGMRRLRREMLARGGLVLGKPDLAEPAIVDMLGTCKPDVIVSWFWTRKIPGPVLKLAPDRFGVHPSLLPRHRGPDPYFWAIAKGDRETGVSAHALTEDYDSGEILAQKSVAIPDHVHAGQLAHLLDRPALEMLVDVATRLARLEVIDGTPQDPADGTDAPFVTDDDCEIRWDQPTADVLRLVRAAAPDPGAFTGYGDETIVIARACKYDGSVAVLEPGDVARCNKGVVVRTSDGAILIELARREGELTPRRGAAVAELFPDIATL